MPESIEILLKARGYYAQEFDALQGRIDSLDSRLRRAGFNTNLLPGGFGQANEKAGYLDKTLSKVSSKLIGAGLAARTIIHGLEEAAEAVKKVVVEGEELGLTLAKSASELLKSIPVAGQLGELIALGNSEYREMLQNEHEAAELAKAHNAQIEAGNKLMADFAKRAQEAANAADLAGVLDENQRAIIQNNQKLEAIRNAGKARVTDIQADPNLSPETRADSVRREQALTQQELETQQRNFEAEQGKRKEEDESRRAKKVDGELAVLQEARSQIADQESEQRAAALRAAGDEIGADIEEVTRRITKEGQEARAKLMAEADEAINKNIADQLREAAKALEEASKGRLQSEIDAINAREAKKNADEQEREAKKLRDAELRIGPLGKTVDITSTSNLTRGAVVDPAVRLATQQLDQSKSQTKLLEDIAAGVKRLGGIQYAETYF